MIKINENCVNCNICVDICPSNVIKVIDNKKELDGTCLECGHCEAICPTSALTNELINHDEEPLEIGNTVITADQAELFLRSRRSVRCFKEETISKADMQRLVDIGKYAQTPKNTQNVTFIVVSGREKVQQLSNMAKEYYLASSFVDQGTKNLIKDESKDIFFRHAPNVIIALAPKSNIMTDNNARFALTYIEQFAPALGIGTCWAGFFEAYAQRGKDLYEFLEIPEGLAIKNCLFCGYPKYSYKRTVSRNPIQILWR